MGLDQYAYAIDGSGNEHELMTWRKHPNLQGFMEQLWEDKDRMCFDSATFKEAPFTEGDGGCMGDFNQVGVLLDEHDIDSLEVVVLDGELPETSGFFFGESQPEDKEDDLTFIEKAKDAIKQGWKVVYSSWW